MQVSDKATVEQKSTKKKQEAKPVEAKVEVEELPTLALGRVVYYVTGSGTVRPAVITQINDEETGDVDLTVFNSQGAVPAVGAVHSTDLEPGTYYWPEVP